MHWLTLLRPVRDHEALENEWHIVVKAYKFKILRDFLYYHILHVRAIPTYEVYRLYDEFLKVILNAVFALLFHSFTFLLPSCVECGLGWRRRAGSMRTQAPNSLSCDLGDVVIKDAETSQSWINNRE